MTGYADYELAKIYGIGIFVIIDTDSGLLPNRHEAITWTNAETLSYQLLS